MRKRLRAIGNLGLMAALALALTVPVTARAEDRQGAAGWQVTFDGKKMESNFTTANIGDEINSMQPGDSVEFTIKLQNSYDGQADCYMQNQVLETLEDAGDAQGGAYDYLLTYTEADGQTTTLYSSEKFGGDGRINGVGLHGATTSLQDYFYLGRMGNGDAGTVKLKVALDGETLVNNYQNTAARLQMNFAAELVPNAPQTVGDPGDDGNPGDNGNGGNGNTGGNGNPGDNGNTGGNGNPGDNGNTGGNGNSSDSGRSGIRTGLVRTGDESRMVMYVAIMLTAGLVCLFLGVVAVRRRQEEEAARETVPTGKGRR